MVVRVGLKMPIWNIGGIILSNIVNSITLEERFLENLFFLITFPIIVVVMHHFFQSLLGNKINKKLYIFLVYIVYSLVNCIVYALSINEYCRVLFQFSFILIISLFYHKNFRWKICASLFLLALIYLSDIIAVASMMLFIAGDQIVFTMIKLVFGKMVIMVLELIAVKSFTSFGKGRLALGWLITAIITPILSIVVLCVISQIQDIMLTEYMPVVFLPIAMALICINYFIYILCDNIIFKQHTKKQNLLLKQQVEYYQNQYQLAEQSQKETLKFRHDIKNILLGLKADIDGGKVLEGNDMLKTLIEDFGRAKQVAHSGNLIIDSIINYKRKYAEQFTIPFQMDFQFPNNIILDTSTISVILGNAIDNAIEACKEIKSKDKYIKIQFNYQNESLFIKIENPFANSIRKDISGNIITRKKNSRYHGIGLQSIREMVEKVNGMFDISHENHLFIVQIILFDIKTEELRVTKGRM